MVTQNPKSQTEKTSRYTFAASFIEATPKQITISGTKKTLIFFLTTHNLFTPPQESKILGFVEKQLKALLRPKMLKVFDHFRQKKARCRSKQDP